MMRTSTAGDAPREPVAGGNRRRNRFEDHLGASDRTATSRIRRALPLQSELEWPQGKKSGTAEVFAFVSFWRRGRFCFALHPRAPSTGGSAKRWGL